MLGSGELVEVMPFNTWQMIKKQMREPLRVDFVSRCGEKRKSHLTESLKIEAREHHVRKTYDNVFISFVLNILKLFKTSN